MACPTMNIIFINFHDSTTLSLPLETRTGSGCSCQDASEEEQPRYPPASPAPRHPLLCLAALLVPRVLPTPGQRGLRLRNAAPDGHGEPGLLSSPPFSSLPGKPTLSSKFLLAWLPSRSGNSTLINVSANPSSAGGASNSFTVPRVQKDPQASPLAP